MNRPEFEQLVHEAIKDLPEQGRKAMDNVVFVIERSSRHRNPNEAGIRADEELLGLYEGTPKIKRGAGYSGVIPDKITIFQKPIERIGGGEIGKIKKIVREVVWHEVGHHLGFDEKEILALEAKKKLIK